MDVILQQSLHFVVLVAGHIEASVGMSLDEIALVSEGTLIGSDKLEPAAGVFVLISHDLDAIVLLVLEDAESNLALLVNDGELVAFLVDVEVLILVVVVFGHLQLHVIVDSEHHLLVQDRTDLVKDL